jgi:hypothetical protein
MKMASGARLGLRLSAPHRRLLVEVAEMRGERLSTVARRVLVMGLQFERDAAQ